MSMIFDMKADCPSRGNYVPGKCAKCGKPVWEALFTLDDCYNVWAGRCPHCGAINYLALVGLRGYCSTGMELVLPTDEEKAANNLPADCPTSGPCGHPPDIHGSNSGEILHRLAEGGE